MKLGKHIYEQGFNSTDNIDQNYKVLPDSFTFSGSHYTDVTSIENWELTKDVLADFKQIDVRSEIKTMFENMGGEGTWSYLDSNQKVAVAKNILVKKSLRDEVLDVDTQRENIMEVSKLHLNKYNEDKIKSNIDTLETLTDPNEIESVFTEPTNFFYSPFSNENIVFVESLSDLPPHNKFEITLEDSKIYVIMGTVDLEGSGLIADGNVTILGYSKQTSILKSTGSTFWIVDTMSDITIKDITIDCDYFIRATGRELGSPNVYLENLNIKNCNNVHDFDTIDTVYINNVLLDNSKEMVFYNNIQVCNISNLKAKTQLLTGNIIKVQDTSTILDVFKITNSRFEVSSNMVGINFSPSATIGDEDFIVSDCDFSGSGTYSVGIDQTSVKSHFSNNRGIINTALNGIMFMSDNATATTISTIDTWVKIAGVTAVGALNSRFTHTDNRLSPQVSHKRRFKITASLTFTSGASEVCAFGIYDSTTSSVIASSAMKTTANSAGRAENISIEAVVEQTDSEFIEIWCKNTSSTTNITVTDLNVIEVELP